MSKLSDVEQAYYEKWVGGAPRSGTGSILYFPTSILDGGEVTMVHFNGATSTQIDYHGTDQKMMSARFVSGLGNRNDLVMDNDAVQESKNIAPDLSPSPYQLKDGEAVLVVNSSGRSSRIKITGIKYKNTVQYPSMPRNMQR
ncbi:MAG: hypothetical protein WBA16_04335 [Nonlabens sp.]